MKVTYTHGGLEASVFENLDIHIERYRSTYHFCDDELNLYYCYGSDALIIENEEKRECKIIDYYLIPSFFAKKDKLILYFESPDEGYGFSVTFGSVSEIYEFSKKLDLNKFPDFFEILKNLVDDGIEVNFTNDAGAVATIGREKNIYVADDFCYCVYYFITKKDDIEVVTSEKSPEENLKILRRFLRNDYSILEKEKIRSVLPESDTSLKFICKILLSG